MIAAVLLIGNNKFKKILKDNVSLHSQPKEVREAGTSHPRKKIKTYLGIIGFLWALE